MNKDRFEWVDSLKFLGMLAIYVGHLGAGAGKLVPFVFSYHVPLFFFISGFFAKEVKGKSFHVFVIEKAKRLLLPYFAFCFAILFMNSLNNGADFRTIISHTGDIMYGLRNNQYVGTVWFINCMFVMIVIDAIALRLIHNKYIILLISLICFIIPLQVFGYNPLNKPRLFWNADAAFSCWWLLALGRCMFKGLCESKLVKKNIYGYIALSVLGLFSLYQLFNSRSLIEALTMKYAPSLLQSSAFWPVNFLITTSSLIVFNVFIAKVLSNFSFAKRIGQNTLNICGLEVVTKTFIPLSLAALGLSFSIPNPLSAIVYALVCLYISNKIGIWLSTYIGRPFKF